MKALKVMAISILCLMFMATTAFATVPKQAKDIAHEQIKYWVPSIENQKTNYGLTDSDNISEITLGEGFQVHYSTMESHDNVCNGKEGLPLDQIYKSQDEYVFPFFVNGKPTGLVWVGKDGGNYNIYGISSHDEFPSWLETAKGKIKEKFGKEYRNDELKFVFDRALNVRGFALKNGVQEYLITVHDNGTLGLKKFEAAKASEHNVKLKSHLIKLKENADNERIGGTGGMEVNEEPKGTAVAMWIGIVAIFFSFVFGGYKVIRKRT